MWKSHNFFKHLDIGLFKNKLKSTTALPKAYWAWPWPWLFKGRYWWISMSKQIPNIPDHLYIMSVQNTRKKVSRLLEALSSLLPALGLDWIGLDYGCRKLCTHSVHLYTRPLSKPEQTASRKIIERNSVGKSFMPAQAWQACLLLSKFRVTTGGQSHVYCNDINEDKLCQRRHINASLS